MADLDVSDLITVERACSIIDAVAVAPRVKTVPIGQAAGLVLAEDILTDRDYPPFDKSLMDGFAVRAEDVSQTPATLRIVGETAAGQKAAREIDPGESVAIMTGAPLPVGADSVIPVELSQRNGTTVTFAKPVAIGHAITRRGGDSGAGVRVVSRGTRLGPTQLAAAATVGAARVSIFRPPTAFVLSTGDEVVSITSRPPPHKIRNSNNILISSLLTKLGVVVEGETHVPDDRKRIASAVSRAMKHDLIFISGGMSMGEYDFAPQVLSSLGFTSRITKLRIRPGKPFVFATRDEGPFAFGLPGNPVSAYVCTLRLAARLLRRMTGENPEPRWIDAPLAETLGSNGPREFYLPARWGGAKIVPSKWKGSADVFTLAAADALIVRPENDRAREAGEVVRVMEIPK